MLSFYVGAPTLQDRTNPAPDLNHTAMTAQATQPYKIGSSDMGIVIKEKFSESINYTHEDPTTDTSTEG